MSIDRSLKLLVATSQHVMAIITLQQLLVYGCIMIISNMSVGEGARWRDPLLKSILSYDNQMLTQDRYGPNQQVSVVL